MSGVTSRVRRLPANLVRTVFGLGALVLIAGCGGTEDTAADATSSADAAGPAAPNTLTAAEVAEGWTLVFDGESTAGFRGYGRDDMPESWVVEDGTLTHAASSGNMDGGDIITIEEFDDFDLVFDFRVAPEGNSGVFFHVQEQDGYGLWQVAPEYQVLDDPAYIAMGTMDMTRHLTGDNYALHEATERPLNPTGEWNTGRIVVRGDHVQHWLNGVMTVEYDMYTDDWEARVAASKFGVEPHYGRATSGAIGFQDHGTPVWYRNVKIRRLDG